MVAANRACSTLFGDDLVGANVIRRYYGDASTPEAIVNWPDVAWAGLARLQQRLRQAPLDEELRALVELAEAAVADLPRRRTPGHDLVVCPHFRVGDGVIRTIGMVARFDTAIEVTLDELRIELIYPQDAAAERSFRRRAQSRTGEDTRLVSLPERSNTDDEQRGGHPQRGS